MRNTIASIALSASLVGCASFGKPPIGAGPDLATIVAEIRSDTQFICRFVPNSDGALRALISKFTTTVPGVSIGWAIADQICNLVKASSATVGASRRGLGDDRSVVVNGVVIKGTLK